VSSAWRLIEYWVARPEPLRRAWDSIGSPVALCHWKPSFIASKRLAQITPPGCRVQPGAKFPQLALGLHASLAQDGKKVPDACQVYLTPFRNAQLFVAWLPEFPRVAGS